MSNGQQAIAKIRRRWASMSEYTELWFNAIVLRIRLITKD